MAVLSGFWRLWAVFGGFGRFEHWALVAAITDFPRKITEWQEKLLSDKKNYWVALARNITEWQYLTVSKIKILNNFFFLFSQ